MTAWKKINANFLHLDNRPTIKIGQTKSKYIKMEYTGVKGE